LELILFTNSVKSKSEIPEIIDLFEHGLQILHVKKNKWTRSKMKAYLKLIPREYRDRIVLHNHYDLSRSMNLRGIHIGKRQQQKRLRLGLQLLFLQLVKPKMKISTSFFNIQELLNAKDQYDYVFLKPVFDRHGNRTFSSLFNKRQLQSALEKSKNRVFALGGTNIERIGVAEECGFKGVGLQNAYWEVREKRTDFFKELLAECANPRKSDNGMSITKVQIDL